MIRQCSGYTEAAGPNYESAFKIARSINSPDLIWKIFAGMAETYKIRGDYDKVVQLNDSALKIIENMRNTLKDNELQASYMASERFAFEDIINMLEMFHEKESNRGYDKACFRIRRAKQITCFIGSPGRIKRQSRK